MSILLQVQFEVSDATKRTFPDSSFDVVYSRDTILHISDKLRLFKKFYVSMSVCVCTFVCISAGLLLCLARNLVFTCNLCFQPEKKTIKPPTQLVITT